MPLQLHQQNSNCRLRYRGHIVARVKYGIYEVAHSARREQNNDDGKTDVQHFRYVDVH